MRESQRYPKPLGPFGIVLVNGISAVGKTTVARELAPRLQLPLFTKDAVKEALFDALGVQDRAWAHRLSGATHAVLNPILEELLQNRIGFVVEANFNPAHDVAKIAGWQHRFAVPVVQLLVWADGEIVYERFRRRIENGKRHPGHQDHTSLDAWRDYLLAGRCEPLALDAPVIEVDTTNFDRVNYAALAEAARAALEPSA